MRFERDQHSSAEVIRNLVNTPEVRDILVEQEPIEDIIKCMYLSGEVGEWEPAHSLSHSRHAARSRWFARRNFTARGREGRVRGSNMRAPVGSALAGGGLLLVRADDSLRRANLRLSLPDARPVAFWFEDRVGIVPPVFNMLTLGRCPLTTYSVFIQFLLSWIIPFAFASF